MNASLKPDTERALIDEIAAFYSDPLGFVRFVFPWGEPGLLANESGPDTWQVEVLQKIADLIQRGENLHDALRLAVASGHGVGKTALVAWIVLWFASTRINPQIVVTANTKNQLTTKTWRELAKWHRLSLHRHWFEWSATSFRHVKFPSTWFASAIPWSEHNSEAFAGTHETDVLLIFDEASAIADTIWDVSEGAMTTSGAMWLVFGNPTRNSGRFARCFGDLKHRWIQYRVDSRKAKQANQNQIAQWIADYGEDSDFVRVRVKGEFPRAASMQWIGAGVTGPARLRVTADDAWRSSARIMGVDVARHGDDQSVIVKRQGIQLHLPKRYRFDDLMQLAYQIAQEIQAWQPDAVFIDATGIGWGVIDRLKQLGYRKVQGVQTAEKAIETARFFNLRMELWARMRDWLSECGSLPNDPELVQDLESPEYFFDRTGRLQLESKEDMKTRGQASPDSADALALTFAAPVADRRDEASDEWERRIRAIRKQGPQRSPMSA